MKQIRAGISYLFAPKRYRLFLYCDQCRQKLESKHITTDEVTYLMNFWNKHHGTHKK